MDEPSEMRAAAERLLRGHQSYDHCATDGHRKEAWNRDACEVAREWLAEHPADDQQPVTEEFLRSINWAPVGNTWYTAEEDCGTPIVFWVDVDQSLRVAGLKDWKICEPTRGQFRRVLAALCIPPDPRS